MIVTFDFNLKTYSVCFTTRTPGKWKQTEDLPEDLYEYAYDGRPLQHDRRTNVDSIVSLVVVDLDDRKGHGSRYITDEFKQQLEDIYLMPIEQLVTTYTDEFIDQIRQEIRNEQRDAYKVYMTDINGNRFKDWKDAHSAKQNPTHTLISTAGHTII